jgi:hypothetical protein
MLGTFNSAFPRVTSCRRMENNLLSNINWLQIMTTELQLGTTERTKANSKKYCNL